MEVVANGDGPAALPLRSAVLVSPRPIVSPWLNRVLSCPVRRLEMAWARVLAFADPLPCAAALQSTAQAEILPTERGRFGAEVTQIGIEKLRMQRFAVALPQVITVA